MNEFADKEQKSQYLYSMFMMKAIYNPRTR